MKQETYKQGRKIARTYWNSVSFRGTLNEVKGAIFKIGNLKIGTDTVIFNMTSTKDCMGRALGLCQLANPKHCYARQNELFRHHKDANGRRIYQVLRYRRRQNKYWDRVTVRQFIDDILYIKEHSSHDIRYIRFNEAGEIRDISDLVKLSCIADGLKEYGIRCYTYTTRKDLKGMIETSDNLTINGSGFMWDNEFRVVNKPLNEIEGLVCMASKTDMTSVACQRCKLCTRTMGKTISEKLRK